MPTLNEYIGGLVSSITNARVMTDIQTIKVAEEYAKHNLLKHFPVPRMKIDDIEMTIPVALEDIQEKTETEYKSINLNEINKLVYVEILNYMGYSKLPEESFRKINMEIEKKTQVLDQNILLLRNLSPLKIYVKEIVDRISDWEKELAGIKKDVKRKTKIESMPEVLENILLPKFDIQIQNKTIDKLNVIVEANRLREQKPENIIYIKLKVSENNMEWDRSENSAGEIESRLLPE